MPDGPTGLFRLVAELRRRHVFRATVAYAAVAFVVLQGAEIVIPAFGLSDAVLRLVVVFAALGVPVVAVLAWVYEITPRGVRTMRELDAEAGVTDPGAGDILPRVALLVVTLAAVGAAGWAWVTREAPPLSAGDTPSSSPVTAARAGDRTIRSLAVLPLETISAEMDREYFAAGMHEALISQLSQLGSLRVISRTSTVSFDRTGKAMPEIGRELGVDGVVEGSVLLDRDRVRITVQLVHAPSDTHVWSRDYERELEDVIGLQREVAGAIVAEIQGELEPGEDPVRTAGVDLPAADPQAAVNDLMGRGMALTGDSPESYRKARMHFEEALREDSTYTPAMVGMAYTTVMEGLEATPGAVPAGELVASAREWVRRALELDPGSREAAELGALLGEVAEVEEVRVSAPPVPRPGRPGAAHPGVGPGGDASWVWSDEDLVPPAAPVTELGSRFLVRLASLDSRGARGAAAAARLGAARTLAAAGQHEEAEQLLEGLLEESPGLVPAWEELESLHVARGELDAVVELRRAREEVEGAEVTAPGAPSVEALARAVEAEGTRGYWEWRREELLARQEAGRPVSHVALASCYAALGEDEAAMEHLAQAAEEEDPRLTALHRDPFWDAHRSDPRFRDILREAMGGPRGGSDGAR